MIKLLEVSIKLNKLLEGTINTAEKVNSPHVWHTNNE